MARPGQTGRGLAFSVAQSPRCAPERATGLLMMNGNRIVNQRLHSGSLQMSRECIALFTGDDIEVVHMGAWLLRSSQEMNRRVVHSLVIHLSDLAAAAGPPLE